MKFRHILTVLLIALISILTSLLVAYASNNNNNNNNISPSQQKQIETIIHNYLVKNPEVIIEAIQALQQKQVDEAKKNIKQTELAAPKFATELFYQTNDPVAGNPNGKVTIVEFFDYQCPHCDKLMPIIDALIKANPELRIVFKELPIRGAASEFASKAALAAKNQNKYFDFHKALMKQSANEQPLTEATVVKVAQSIGLDVEKLKKDMKADAINQQIKINTKLAQQLQLVGTPALFVAKTDVVNHAAPPVIAFVPGLTDQPQLEATIKKVYPSNQ